MSQFIVIDEPSRAKRANQPLTSDAAEQEQLEFVNLIAWLTAGAPMAIALWIIVLAAAHLLL
jgi:hypothetical protein